MLGGKVALITGATGGLGVDTVRAFADAGASIVAVSRGSARLVALEEQLDLPPARWLALPVDLTDPGATQAAVDDAVERFGRIDILVALAGGWRGGATVATMDLPAVNWLLQTNLITAFNACRAVLPGMIAQGFGRIVAVGARSAVGGQARSGAYAASKAAVVALIQSVALETKHQGVTANVVLASTINTAANRASMPDADHDRWVPPADIAATIRFLCSDQAASISGAVIPVYGRV